MAGSGERRHRCGVDGGADPGGDLPRPGPASKPTADGVRSRLRPRDGRVDSGCAADVVGCGDPDRSSSSSPEWRCRRCSAGCWWSTVTGRQDGRLPRLAGDFRRAGGRRGIGGDRHRRGGAGGALRVGAAERAARDCRRRRPAGLRWHFRSGRSGSHAPSSPTPLATIPGAAAGRPRSTSIRGVCGDEDPVRQPGRRGAFQPADRHRGAPARGRSRRPLVHRREHGGQTGQARHPVAALPPCHRDHRRESADPVPRTGEAAGYQADPVRRREDHVRQRRRVLPRTSRRSTQTSRSTCCSATAPSTARG